MLEFFGDCSCLSDGVSDLLLVEIYDFTITFDDFFEHKKLPP